MPHSAARLVAALVPDSVGPTDAELLARFSAERDAGAFELLVWRHAGLVLRVCRGVLGDHHAAEDATQAVFLALARQATSVGRSGSAAGWLFRVARRIAVRAARRRSPPTVPCVNLDDLPSPNPIAAPNPDLERVLHEELTRLPERYRAPVLLCFFEGLSHAEAARRLEWPIGTVAGRMARAKDMLASRLLRRGVSLSLLTPVAIAVQPPFVAATTSAALVFATKGTPLVPSTVIEFAEREIRMKFVKGLFGASAVAVATCACLALGLVQSAEPPPAPSPQPALRDKVPMQRPPAPVIEKTFAIAPVTTDLQRRIIQFAGADTTVIVFMDGAALFKTPTTLDVEAFDMRALRMGLKSFPVSKGKSGANFNVHYTTPSDMSRDGEVVINFAIEGLAREAGYVPANATSTMHNGTFDFENYTRPLKDTSGAEETEAAVGDERVKAYPVHTPLSRVLTGSAGGVICVHSPLDAQADDWVPAEVNASVKAAIEKLKLTKGQGLNFLLNIKRGNNTQERASTACEKWAKDAGLEYRQITY